MKNLQDLAPETWILEATMALKTIERKVESPRSLILLLHGLDERGLRIYRKLLRYLPEDAYIIAPNAPFPLPRLKADRMDFGYTWYFYDKFTQSYEVDQTLALSLIKDLLNKANPEKLPVTVIGFSQGGYLAPLVGYQNPMVNRVIGIGCEFRTHFFKEWPNFKLNALHGAEDTIIPPQNAKKEIESLKEMGINVSWHLIAEARHEITSAMGEVVKSLLES